MIRWERTKSRQVKWLLCTTGDSEMRPKPFYTVIAG